MAYIIISMIRCKKLVPYLITTVDCMYYHNYKLDVHTAHKFKQPRVQEVLMSHVTTN